MVAFALLSSPAAAIDASAVMPCLNLTPTDVAVGAEVILTVDLHDGAIASLSVTDYKPDTEAAYRVARAAYRAVMMCSPYGAETGSFTFMIAGEGHPPATIPLPGTQ